MNAKVIIGIALVVFIIAGLIVLRLNIAAAAQTPALSTGSSPGRMPRLAAMPSPFCWLPSPRRS